MKLKTIPTIKERINDFDMGNSELANMVNTFYVVLPICRSWWRWRRSLEAKAMR